MKLDKTLLVLDVETTGLHPDRCEVLEVGIVAVSPRTLTKTLQFEMPVRLSNPLQLLRSEFWSAKKVHKIPLKEIVFGGFSLKFVLDQLDFVHEQYPDALIAGNNVGFDYAMVKRMYEMEDRKTPFDYHLVDLTALAAVHLGITSLSKIATALGQDASRYTKHTALGDAELTADCFIALLKSIEADQL